MGIKNGEILKNFNMELEGVGYAGQVSEITVPNLTIKTEDQLSGGMDTPLKRDMGTEELFCEFTLMHVDPDSQKRVGVFNNHETQLMVYGAKHDDKSPSAKNITITMRGMLSSVEYSAFKVGEVTTDKYRIELKYYERTEDGQPLHKIDIENMQRVIGGTDQIASIRAAIKL